MIKLRTAQYSDFAAIAKLNADNWRIHYRGILSDNYLDHVVEKDRFDAWQQRLKSPAENQIVTVAIEGREIVGFCCLLLNDDPVFGSLIDNLHVSTNWQKSGIGKMMVKDCAKVVINKANSRKMYLWVYESNKNARSAYEHLGALNFETVVKSNEDGTRSRACRYTWNDVSKLIQ